jgi:hypothetical protein
MEIEFHYEKVSDIALTLPAADFSPGPAVAAGSAVGAIRYRNRFDAQQRQLF